MPSPPSPDRTAPEVNRDGQNAGDLVVSLRDEKEESDSEGASADPEMGAEGRKSKSHRGEPL